MRLFTVVPIVLIGFSLAASPAGQGVQEGSISGAVVRADTGEPIAGARVLIALNDQDGGLLLDSSMGIEHLAFLPQVRTDAQGRFLFADLRPGRYTVTADRSGYARQQHGARAPGRAGTPLTLERGRQIRNVVVPLARTGVVTGHATDDTGEPLAGVTVLIERSAYGPDGRRELQVAGINQTDDRGEYRLYGVSPGHYYLAVSPRRSRVDIAEAGYVSTYYPGVSDESLAVMIDVEPAAEVRAIDFQLSRRRVFKVRGRLPDLDRDFRPDLVWLSPTVPLPDVSHHEGTINNGTFTILDVVPGSYRIDVAAGEVMLLTGSVEVVDADVEGVVLSSNRGVHIDARVRWEDAASGQDRGLIGISLDPVDSDDGRSAIADSDGALHFVEVTDGDYRLRLLHPQNSYLKSARLGAVDILHRLSVTGPLTQSLDIVVSRRVGRIDGMLVDAAGRAASGGQVVLLPTRPADRVRGRVFTAMSDEAGQFQLTAVPPGDYKLFAWDDLEPYGYFDAGFVREYEKTAVPVKVLEGSAQRIRLTVARVSPR